MTFDLQGCFLAYWYTFGAPPAGARAEPGVIVMVVNQACHAHALDDPACEANAAWCRNFEGWCATGAEMAIYEWYIPGSAYLLRPLRSTGGFERHMTPIRSG